MTYRKEKKKQKKNTVIQIQNVLLQAEADAERHVRVQLSSLQAGSTNKTF